MCASDVVPDLPEPDTIVLEDGTTVVIRPIRPDDAAYLKSTFPRLSAQSIYFRFMTYKRELTDEEARRFANVDYVTQMAFVALCEEDGEEVVAGVARYALLDTAQPGIAEAAVIVGDEYQGRGIGKILLDRLLKYARQRGLRALRGNLLLENDRMMGMVARSGLPYQKRYAEGYWEVTVDLSGI